MRGLVQDHHLLHIALEHLPAAVAVFEGRELRARLVNPAYQAFAPGKEMVGRSFEEIWPELRPEVASTLRRVLETGEPYSAVDDLHKIRRTAEGPLENAWFNWSAARVRRRAGSGGTASW